MRFTLQFSQEVRNEAASIYSHREQEKRGSGERFLETLAECYGRIKVNPFAFQVRKRDYRYAHLNRLKYRLVFKVEGTTILILQLRHTSQKPSKRFGP